MLSSIFTGVAQPNDSDYEEVLIRNESTSFSPHKSPLSPTC